MYPVNDLTRKTLTSSLCSWTARYLDLTESNAGMQKLAGLTDAKNDNHSKKAGQLNADGTRGFYYGSVSTVDGG